MLAARQRGADRLAARGDRHQGARLVRLRGQVRRGGHGAGRSGADLRSRPPSSLRELARQVFTLCGCSGLARCDFFVDGDEVLVNELNTIPGFTETSVYGKLFEADGIAYPELCDRLVELAVERYEGPRATSSSPNPVRRAARP